MHLHFTFTMGICSRLPMALHSSFIYLGFDFHSRSCVEVSGTLLTLGWLCSPKKRLCNSMIQTHKLFYYAKTLGFHELLYVPVRSLTLIDEPISKLVDYYIVPVICKMVIFCFSTASRQKAMTNKYLIHILLSIVSSDSN